MAINDAPAGGMLNRRTFLKSTSLAIGACGLAQAGLIEGWASAAPGGKAVGLTAAELPKGSAPKPVPFPHFPDRLHAFVWRNWQLVPARRMGEVVGASSGEIVRLGRSMGLAGPPKITTEQQRRAALSIIKRNWQLLPYEQLLQLLGWTAEQMAFTLREDDFLYVKLGNLKPQCEPLRYVPPDERTQARARDIAGILQAEFPKGVGEPEQPLFDFVRQLSRPPKGASRHAGRSQRFLAAVLLFLLRALRRSAAGSQPGSLSGWLPGPARGVGRGRGVAAGGADAAGAVSVGCAAERAF